MSVTRVDDDRKQGEKFYSVVVGVPFGALIGIVVVLVLGLGAAIWLVQARNSAQDDLERVEAENEAYAAGPDAQAAAERILGEMISYDYRDIRGEYAWTEYLADDELRSDYEDRLTPKLAKVIRKLKSSAQGEVVQSAYNIVDEDQVQVIAFIRQRIRTATDKKGVTDEQWTSLTMVREGDEWLIGEVTPLDVPPAS